MIKLMHEQLNLSTGSPVKIKWCDYDHFKYPLHFHSEYEIVYILESTGKRFVGNNIEPYAEGTWYCWEVLFRICIKVILSIIKKMTTCVCTRLFFSFQKIFFFMPWNSILNFIKSGICWRNLRLEYISAIAKRMNSLEEG